jgi:hypothetical protein
LRKRERYLPFCVLVTRGCLKKRERLSVLHTGYQIFEKERERDSVLCTGYQMIFEKERERLSVLYTGDQMIFEKERERNFRFCILVTR